MISLLQYIRGYVRIRVWGLAPERLMNLCGNRDILLWDIVKEGDAYTMCVSVRGFKQLRPLVRKTNTRVAILQRYGLPFFMPLLRKRRIFILGLLLCVAFWIFSSYFVWDIELSGNYRITEDVFFSYLKENSVTVGMRKKELDIEALEKDIRRQFPLITWTSVRLDGTRLSIAVRENDAAEHALPEAEEGGKDLIAPYDGVIVSMIVKSGVPKAAIGDAVSAGTVLVEGKLPVLNDDATVREYRYVASDADIVMEHALERRETLPFDYIQKEYTGREAVRYFLRLGDWELKAAADSPFLVYDSVIREMRPALFEKLSVPAFAGSVTCREYRNVEHSYSREEAEEALLQKINDFFAGLEEKGVQIIEKDVKIEKGTDAWELRARMTVRERAFQQADTPVEAPAEGSGQGEI